MQIKSFRLIKESTLDTLDSVGAMTSKANDLVSSIKKNTGLTSRNNTNVKDDDSTNVKDEDGFIKDYFIFKLISNNKNHSNRTITIGREDEEYFYKISDKDLIVKNDKNKQIIIKFPIRIKNIVRNVPYEIRFITNYGFTDRLPNGETREFNRFQMVFPKEL